MIAVDNLRLQRLRKSGIQVKTQKSDNSYLHHKFCLIDEKNKNSAKMFCGSLNLTLQGIVRNYEHVTLTNDYDIIQSFSEEFEKLWADFD
ncbi:hypothetical protein HHI36_001745 [Cryptolaemus montrouzieri]|uniref:Mitochondrial cardiolipin hydrolase n=1 Tax=Cryptolaemus montrouzieri TaxID=559131 RepID=A0ABD2P8C7_9CUCU